MIVVLYGIHPNSPQVALKRALHGLAPEDVLEVSELQHGCHDIHGKYLYFYVLVEEDTLANQGNGNRKSTDEVF